MNDLSHILSHALSEIHPKNLEHKYNESSKQGNDSPKQEEAWKIVPRHPHCLSSLAPPPLAARAFKGEAWQMSTAFPIPC